MSNAIAADKNPTIQQAIDQVLNELENLTADAPEFAKTVDQLEKLIKIQNSTLELKHKLSLADRELEQKAEERASKKKFNISGDALITAGASLAGILMILSYERANVIATKALGFIAKAR